MNNPAHVTAATVQTEQSSVVEVIEPSGRGPSDSTVNAKRIWVEQQRRKCSKPKAKGNASCQTLAQHLESQKQNTLNACVGASRGMEVGATMQAEATDNGTFASEVGSIEVNECNVVGKNTGHQKPIEADIGNNEQSSPSGENQCKSLEDKGE